MNTVPKPYIRTSGFWIMIGSIVGGIPVLMLVAAILPHLPLTEVQGAQLLQLVFGGWIALMGVTTHGNIKARAAISLAKTVAQRGIPQLGNGLAPSLTTPDFLALLPLLQQATALVPATAPAVNVNVGGGAPSDQTGASANVSALSNVSEPVAFEPLMFENAQEPIAPDSLSVDEVGRLQTQVAEIAKTKGAGVVAAALNEVGQ